MSKAKNVPIEVKPTCAPQFIRVADQVGHRQRFAKGCLAGISYCIISPRGDVQPAPIWICRWGTCATCLSTAFGMKTTPFKNCVPLNTAAAAASVIIAPPVAAAVPAQPIIIAAIT